MAFDGITVAALVKESQNKILNGRINKIAQPEEDELLLTIKNDGMQYRLLISANASLPLYYLTDENKISPMTAPGFCMLLRKHIGTGRITSINQPDFERVIDMRIEHLNELGDLCAKHLYIELMGKHSNIIFTDDDGKILDSIKRVSAAVSSVREVLPGRDYFIPKTADKRNPMLEDEAAVIDVLSSDQNAGKPLYKAIYTSYTGVSPIAANEICHRVGVDADIPFGALPESVGGRVASVFVSFFENVKKGLFSPSVYYENDVPAEYSAVNLEVLTSGGARAREYDSISGLIENYYEEKCVVTRIRQRSADLRHIVSTHLERNVKKYDLQLKQLADTDKRDMYKVYGELLNTYGYSAKPGDTEISALNYYTNEEIIIPLDPLLSASENAKKYFDKYGKLKRTKEALDELISETKDEIEHLKSVLMELDIARKEEDLIEIKNEMLACGYIKGSGNKDKAKGKARVVSKPFHYVTEDNYNIYVGKNNFQNDELTFAASKGGNDWWFHAKKIPGSHVVLKSDGREIPDELFELAARLAAFYSRGKEQEKVEVDYTLRKNVKKPAGAKPGFVIYHTNYSMAIEPVVEGVKLVD